jgi:hypothetical protein
VDVVIRPVNDRFLEEVAFPAFEAGVLDAAAGLQALLDRVIDERTCLLLDLMLQHGVEGSFFSLEEDKWLETVYRLLFSEWIEESGGWTVSADYVGFAGDWEQTLHLCLMLDEANYPYYDEAKSRQYRRDFLEHPVAKCGLAAMVCGLWDPFPRFPPDQVLSTAGRGEYQPDARLAIADWSWRPLQEVNTWGAQLPNKLSRLLSRETRRLYPVEAPETHEIVDYWLGRVEQPPTLAVCFSGLGRGAGDWIREVGAIARTVRSAAAMEQGLTAIVTRRGRPMSDSSESD